MCFWFSRRFLQKISTFEYAKMRFWLCHFLLIHERRQNLGVMLLGKRRQDSCSFAAKTTNQLQKVQIYNCTRVYHLGVFYKRSGPSDSWLIIIINNTSQCFSSKAVPQWLYIHVESLYISYEFSDPLLSLFLLLF